MNETEQALEDWSYRFYQDNKDLLQRFLLIRRLSEDPEWSDLGPHVSELLRIAKMKIYGKITPSVNHDPYLVSLLSERGHTYFLRVAFGRFADL